MLTCIGSVIRRIRGIFRRRIRICCLNLQILNFRLTKEEVVVERVVVVNLNRLDWPHFTELTSFVSLKLKIRKFGRQIRILRLKIPLTRCMTLPIHVSETGSNQPCSAGQAKYAILDQNYLFSEPKGENSKLFPANLDSTAKNTPIPMYNTPGTCKLRR